MPRSDAAQALFDRPLDDVLYLSPQGPMTVAAIEQRIERLAERLPDNRYVLNLCTDRHHFLVAFAAIVASGRVNLLPPNSQDDTLAELASRYRDVAVVHDSGRAGLMQGYCLIDVREAANEQNTRTAAPGAVPGARPGAQRNSLAAISFTSGSTGMPRPNKKTWGMLLDGADINRAAMRLDSPEPVSMLATVPPQHMYGLELSVMIPMRSRITVHVSQPLYPADVVDALQSLPAPRTLVTTPAHLRSLLGSDMTLPAVDRIFSATAPLDSHTAAETERAFGNGVLTEIYGCSEVGSIAHRETARDDDWQIFEGLSLVETTTIDSARSEFRIVADHLLEAAELQDSIELIADDQFRLRGRRDDLINFAGKRGSLAELNRRLLAIPGVVDGVIFQPAEARLAALVVAPDLDRSSLITALRRVVDPVFVPRPIVFLERLPRQGSSKLRKADLLAALEHHRHKGRNSA